MQKWLPLALLILAVMLIAAMPWRHPHPNHEFMLSQWSRLSEDTPEQPPEGGAKENPNSGNLAGARRADGAGSTHI